MHASAARATRRAPRTSKDCECSQSPNVPPRAAPISTTHASSRLELLGFVTVADVARPSAIAPIAQLQRAGIAVVMLTGDHPSTAEAIASELGLLDGGVVSGPELDRLTDAQLDALVDETTVFARVTPAHKVRIVEAFQRRGRVVAMTGDGANDAQAIRLADIGIAFGPRATSAARAAADLVVVDDRVETLITAIIEGRAMWASVRDALALLLGGNLGEVIFTTGVGLITGRSPLNARQLLAVNLLTDLAPAMAIALQPPLTRDVDLRREGPDTSLGGALARDVAVRAAATGGRGRRRVDRRPVHRNTHTRPHRCARGARRRATRPDARHRPSQSTRRSAAASCRVGALVGIIQTPGVSQLLRLPPPRPRRLDHRHHRCRHRNRRRRGRAPPPDAHPARYCRAGGNDRPSGSGHDKRRSRRSSRPSDPRRHENFTSVPPQ